MKTEEEKFEILKNWLINKLSFKDGAEFKQELIITEDKKAWLYSLNIELPFESEEELFKIFNK